MPFVPVQVTPGMPLDWSTVTHIRLVPGRKPDTPRAEKSREALQRIRAENGLIELERALATLDPVRDLGDRQTGIKADLRHWANRREDARVTQDKGWLELGYIT
jgi:hypothetical protein